MASITPADIAYAAYLAEDEKAYQRTIVRARKYHAGEQPVELTDRLLEFLGLSDSDPSFILNVARLVTQAAAERLKVIGMDSDEEPTVKEARNPDGTTSEDRTKPLAAWAWELWEKNRGDGIQDEVHTGACRDGEYFILVDGNDTEQRARLTPHPRYTDPQEADGDGYGIKVFYADENERGPIEYATKCWTEYRTTADGEKIRRVSVRRMNIYWPDRAERYEQQKGQWQLLDTVPWLDSAGLPLGVPIVHFRNVDMRCEATDAWPIQDAINKAFVDLVAAEDMAALGLLVILGFYPTTDGLPPAEDGSNALLIQPGSFLYTTKGPDEASASRVPGEDLTQLITAIDAKIKWLSGVTSTPPSRFQASTNVRAEGTLKQEEGPLLAKLEPKMTLFGNAWEDVMYMARRVENTFYGASLPEDILLSTQWAPTATRDEKNEREALVLEQTLGVPPEKLWAKLGYSQWEIDEMKKMKDEAAEADMEREKTLLQARGPMAATNGKMKVVAADG